MLTTLIWDKSATLGHTLITDQQIIEQTGGSGIICCDFVDCGKFRNGRPRKWCKTHQTHWGKKADLGRLVSGDFTCNRSKIPLNFVIDPYLIDLNDYSGGVGIWCATPSVSDTTHLQDITQPLIHVDAMGPQGKKVIDKNFPAILAKSSIGEIPITIPGAIAFLKAGLQGLELDLLNCGKCGHPHLDLGDFAEKPHRKHLCENCGTDHNWSRLAIISTPLTALAQQYNKEQKFVESTLKLDLRDFKDCTWEIWVSTPAIVWTYDKPQITGIHAHIYHDSWLIVQGIFGEIVGVGGDSLKLDAVLGTLCV
jgi:hypothetical protein